VFKEKLLREILEFMEKKRKFWFTKEEFLIYLYYKYRRIRFETIIVQLRKLAREGFLSKKRVQIPEWGFCYYIIYYVNRNKIKSYLLRNELNNKLDLMVYSYAKQ